MLIRICDRCRKTTDRSVATEYRVVKYPENAALDLCDECLKSFNEWLSLPRYISNEAPKKESRPRKVETYKPKAEPVITPPMKETDIFKKPEKKEDPKIQEKIDLETKMNNAYARGNDKLGDACAEKLSKMNSEDEKSSSKKGHKQKVIVSRDLKFKSKASKAAFIFKHGSLFIPYNMNNFHVFVRNRKNAGSPLPERVCEKMKKDMKFGYYDDPDNENVLRIHIDSRMFKNLEHYFTVESIGHNNSRKLYVEK